MRDERANGCAAGCFGRFRAICIDACAAVTRGAETTIDVSAGRDDKRRPVPGSGKTKTASKTASKTDEGITSGARCHVEGNSNEPRADHRLAILMYLWRIS